MRRYDEGDILWVTKGPTNFGVDIQRPSHGSADPCWMRVCGLKKETSSTLLPFGATLRAVKSRRPTSHAGLRCKTLRLTPADNRLRRHPDWQPPVIDNLFCISDDFC
jgi:hypothetical protein